MNKIYFQKTILLATAILGCMFSLVSIHAQHLFSVNYNDLSQENVTQLKAQIAGSEVSTLSLTKNNENRDVYPVAFSSVQNTKIIILNEETGAHVIVETHCNASLPTPNEFQLAPFFIEELRQGILGSANRYVILETANDFSVKSVSAVAATRRDAYIPQYWYGKKENVQEALPQNRQIIHIFKQKPKYFPAFPDDPENLRYVEQLEEEMSYYIYMYKLPDGTLATYDEHFNPTDDKNLSRIGNNLEFVLSGSLNATQQTATEYALGLWSEQLAGTVPVDINVTFTNMGSGVLGGSYRQQDFLNNGQVPDMPTNTYYCSSLWNQLVGYDATSMRDIRIEMSTNFSFYFGLDGNTSGYDYVTIMLHEATHGLGFYPLCGTNGSYSYTTASGNSGSTTYPGIYDRQLFQGLDGVCLTELNQTQRGSLVKSNNLYSGAPDSYLLAANGGVRVKMFAPSSWMSGSSVSHWDQSVNNFATFMKYAYTSPLHIFNTRKIGMMLDLGWMLPGFIPVTEIINVPDTAFVNTPLILTGTVVPGSATNKTINWSIEDAGDTDAILTGNTLYATVTGTVTLLATIIDGIAEDDNYTQYFTISIDKSAQTAPQAPTLASSTPTSITLNEMEDCEFRMDDGEWQTATLFGNLYPNTTYTFVARKAETATHFASPESPTVQFSTPMAHTITATVNDPNFGTIDPTGETLVEEGSSITYTITPYEAYKIYDVWVNGISQGDITTYTFENVQSNETISVEFGLGINENGFGNVQIYSHQNIVHVNIVGALRATPLQVEIMDMTGRIIYLNPITNIETTIPLQVATGIYNVRLISHEGKTVSKKVLIE